MNQITNLVPANFEFCCVPCRILVCRPLDVAERCLIRCNIAVDVERDLDCTTDTSVESRHQYYVHGRWGMFEERRTLQELVPFMPIHIRGEREQRTRTRLERCYVDKHRRKPLISQP